MAKAYVKEILQKRIFGEWNDFCGHTLIIFREYGLKSSKFRKVNADLC